MIRELDARRGVVLCSDDEPRAKTVYVSTMNEVILSVDRRTMDNLGMFLLKYEGTNNPLNSKLKVTLIRYRHNHLKTKE